MITNKLFTDMKLINNTISIILACIILASCSTTQKITVSGYAGTEIYTPDLTKVGTIDNTGKAQIKLDSDDYYAFLLSKSTGSNELIPFALDYRKSSYTGCKIANFLSLYGAVAGVAATGVGIAMIAGGLIIDFIEVVGSNLAFYMYDVAELFLSENIGKVTINGEISMGSVLAGVLVIMLSYVFRYGEELNKQADETL